MAYFVRWSVITVVAVTFLCCVDAMRAMTVVQGEIPAKDSSRPTYRVHLPEMGSLPAMQYSDNVGIDTSGIEMVSAQGQTLTCSFPDQANTDSEIDTGDNESDFDDVEHILAGYVGQCFLRQDGWWSYEFCYNRSIVQFHKAKEPEEEELSFTLGTRSRGSSPASGGTLPYTELYANGTVCDVSGRQREVTVKYICADDTSQMGGISKQTGELFLIKSIKEVETCVYELEFISSAICRQKLYRRNRNKSNRDIRCRLKDEGIFRGLKATSYRKGKATLTL